jgi:Mn-dependent DtxR family transcriptional regulator
VRYRLSDEGESRIADIAARMGVASNYASHYRRHLEEQGVVSTRRRGVVGVDLPLLKDYVARMAAE